jgi:hypothetical protein
MAAVALAACGSPYYTSDPIEAWVVDADTGQPIEGAVVTANWQLVSASLDTGGRKLRQLEVLETTTDKNGRFYFPGFTKINFTLDELREEDPQILIFKPGYQYFRAVGVAESYEAKSGSHRHSEISGKTIALTKYDKSGRALAMHFAALTVGLSNISISGDSKKVSRMIERIVCEQRRLASVDPPASIFSIPGQSVQEVKCDTVE